MCSSCVPKCAGPAATGAAAAPSLTTPKRRRRKKDHGVGMKLPIAVIAVAVVAFGVTWALGTRTQCEVGIDGTCQMESSDGDEAYKVEGSDVPALNGVYVRTDDWNGKPLFTNQGLTAVIYFRETLGPHGAW